MIDKSPLYDHEYRVVLENQDGGKDTLIFGSDNFLEADAAFDMAAANRSGAILLLHRARIVRRSAPAQ